MRKSVQAGYSDYIPVLLSETQKLYRSGTLPCNVAMIQVSSPDKHGFVSLGTSVDATLAAIECAEHVIAGDFFFEADIARHDSEKIAKIISEL